ncbi:metal ABC transporter ATP-binding protein [Clostridium sp. CX1]|uniref:Metal ABC transporter ATP-binding protein n=1 Tax=Clostridium tanneri TaxID=3037988 RepID=A0ABU4JV62_9CLOT|nr:MULTISPECIES: metal ABC transporter ATP-binding protein [unclassified Clostridium]MCT8976602.1 metal ABC transporter ATP-binding protein [Clostridium sp. CX1]MDW8801818.1 metal ABC transporter ATP-binding protein [Clostridium sp. A1-XYC3]
MIQIKDLTFSYTGNPPYVLNNLNLNILNGSYVSILGENGSAKTTLLKLILNLLNPCSGSISLNTDRIGYVPQRVENFNSEFPITVYEMLKCHMKVLNLKSSKAISHSLDSVGMNNFINNLIGDMSGGQQQKVFIARALMGNPKLLVLDEPSTGIDIQSQKEIYSIIKHLNLHLGITVIAVEHNLKAALENSTHICLMESGVATLYTIDEYRKFIRVS